MGFETTNETNYKKCQDIDECQMETACSQRCANFPGSYNCLCDPGYYKSAPNSCKAIERSQAKVFVTNGRSLIISDIDGTYMRVVRKPYVMNEMTAFDFNNRTKRIYWADKTTRAIYSSNENGTNAVKLVSSGIGFVESLAVDWIGMNLYWADYVMQHIEVSNLDGQRRKILFNVSHHFIEYLWAYEPLKAILKLFSTITSIRKIRVSIATVHKKVKRKCFRINLAGVLPFMSKLKKVFILVNIYFL
jgi:hypothetical protein